MAWASHGTKGGPPGPVYIGSVVGFLPEAAALWCGRPGPAALVTPRCSHVFQVPPLPVGPPIAPLASLDSLPAALPDLPAAGGPTVPAPSQYFSPAVILPSLPLSAATAPLPTSPALPLQAVKLPHPPGAPLAVPCRTIVPNVAATATAIPLLAVAPQGMAALSLHPAAVAQLPAQPVYPAAFPQMVPSDVPPSPLHVAQSVRAAPPQPAPSTLQQPHQPSVVRLPEQAAPAGAGSQVIRLPLGCTLQVEGGGVRGVGGTSLVSNLGMRFWGQMREGRAGGSVSWPWLLCAGCLRAGPHGTCPPPLGGAGSCGVVVSALAWVGGAS